MNLVLTLTESSVFTISNFLSFPTSDLQVLQVWPTNLHCVLDTIRYMNIYYAELDLVPANMKKLISTVSYFFNYFGSWINCRSWLFKLHSGRTPNMFQNCSITYIWGLSVLPFMESWLPSNQFFLTFFV